MVLEWQWVFGADGQEGILETSLVQKGDFVKAREQKEQHWSCED